MRKEQVLRTVHLSGFDNLKTFWASKAAPQFIDSGRLVQTKILDLQKTDPILPEEVLRDAVLLVEHDKVFFPSYPYEWPPEMLHAAGLLTLEMAQTLLAEGMGLKDATPFNIQFRGPNPVFVDLLSFEKRDPCDPIWKPDGQFRRTFLLPLLANKYFGLSLDQIFVNYRDGIEPERIYCLAGRIQRLRPCFLWSVTLPTWLGRPQNPPQNAIYEKKIEKDLEQAKFILKVLFKSLHRQMDKFSPNRDGKKSPWARYSATHSYSGENFSLKCRFVEEALGEFSPKRVLDVGCNTGQFSAMAARKGASVVAIDSDPSVGGALWRTAQSGQLDILPLVVNLAHPSPATGWRNHENSAFLDRAQGAFDAVLMLAIIHHLLATDRIPLDEIIDLAANLTTDLLIIEFVAPEDPMFQYLTRGREGLFKDLNQRTFESACKKHFVFIRSLDLGKDKRCLYLLRKK